MTYKLLSAGAIKLAQVAAAYLLAVRALAIQALVALRPRWPNIAAMNAGEALALLISERPDRWAPAT